MCATAVERHDCTHARLAAAHAAKQAKSTDTASDAHVLTWKGMLVREVLWTRFGLSAQRRTLITAPSSRTPVQLSSATAADTMNDALMMNGQRLHAQVLLHKLHAFDMLQALGTGCALHDASARRQQAAAAISTACTPQ